MARFQIISDIDNTVFPLRKYLIYVMKDYFTGKDLFKDFVNSRHYSFSDFVNWARQTNYAEIKDSVVWKHLLRKFGDTEYFIRGEPYAGAKELFDRIYELGGIAHFLTHRGKENDPHFYFNDAYEKTRQWLKKYNLKYEELVFTHNKVEHIKRLEKKYNVPVLATIEDMRSNAVLMAREGYKTILLRKPYHRIGKSKEAIGFVRKGMIIPVTDLFEVKEKIEQLSGKI